MRVLVKVSSNSDGKTLEEIKKSNPRLKLQKMISRMGVVAHSSKDEATVSPSDTADPSQRSESDKKTTATSDRMKQKSSGRPRAKRRPSMKRIGSMKKALEGAAASLCPTTPTKQKKKDPVPSSLRQVMITNSSKADTTKAASTTTTPVRQCQCRSLPVYDVNKAGSKSIEEVFDSYDKIMADFNDQ